MADERPIEEVRAIAHYIRKLLTRMDFNGEVLNQHKRKDFTIYDRGHLNVAVSVQWSGALPPA